VETRLEELPSFVASIEGGTIYLLRVWSREGHQQNLQSKGGRTRPDRGRRMTRPHRDRMNLFADMADSGEQFERPGGASGSGKRRGDRAGDGGFIGS
jgi:hypothetical protein